MELPQLTVEELTEVLNHLGIDGDASEWLQTVEDQLHRFQMERENQEEDVEDDQAPAVVDLRYFGCSAHLLWWTMASAMGCTVDLQVLMANTFVEGQKNYDDFLCLMPLNCYENGEFRSIAAVLCKILMAYDEYESLEKASFHLDDDETISATRETLKTIMTQNVPEFGIVDRETLVTQLELGCHLYASMMASVESAHDELASQRWRECYAAKCQGILEWLRNVTAADTLWACANSDSDLALLVPFTRRAVLFRGRHESLAMQLNDAVIAAQKIFDVEHDDSELGSDFQCPLCGSFKTRSYHLQTSGADESMAQLWLCKSCKKSGKKQ